MSQLVRCTCGATYNLTDEEIDKPFPCKYCGKTVDGRVEPEKPAPASEKNLFTHDRYLMKQRLFSISSKYDIVDDAGNRLLFVRRPSFILRTFGAILAGLFVASVLAAIPISLAQQSGKGSHSALAAVLILLGIVAAFVGFVLTAIALAPKRHVTFWRDEQMTDRVLEVLQDRKLQFLTWTYTVRDASGQVLALLRKNHLYDLFRRRWTIHQPDGTLFLLAKEDSLLKSLARRYFGTLFGILRTNFIFLDPTDRQLGEFNRKFTLLDRYVLDMSLDPQRTVDRRIALAVGVMLDTGERR